MRSRHRERRPRRLWAFIETVFADGGYAGKLIAWAKEETHLALSIVKRSRALPRFEPLPRRWGLGHCPKPSAASAGC